jgi:hypothetical protein
MIALLPLNRIIVAVSVTYGCIVAIVVGVVAQYSDSLNLYSNVKIAIAGATALNLALLFAIHFAWKWLWLQFPKLNMMLFPNLNGTWNMKIHWQGNNNNGEVEASAVIKQDLMRLSMEVTSPGSDSETLIAQPKKDPESGRPILYYVYRVVPKQLGGQSGTPYEGAAILRFSSSAVDALSGNYFTSQNTKGHFVLTRIQ